MAAVHIPLHYTGHDMHDIASDFLPKAATSTGQGRLLQEHARDSFENLLFSLCRFHELTGHYPDDLLVIGYDFKHDRFCDLHRAALKWPDQRFRFVGTPALTANAQEVGPACDACCDISGHFA